MKQRGFTLLEVLVALAVLSVVMFGMFSYTAAHTRNINYLQDRSFAHWVAMNQLVQIQIGEEKAVAGELSGESEMAGRQWFWRADVTRTSNEAVLKLQIEVAADEQFDQPLASLLSYVSVNE